jgi:hypothetical protein
MAKVDITNEYLACNLYGNDISLKKLSPTERFEVCLLKEIT